MKFVEVSPSNLFLGGREGPIFFLEENLGCQVIRKHHTKFPSSSSKRLEKIPCLKLGTDDRRYPRLKNYSPWRNLNSVVDKNCKYIYIMFYRNFDNNPSKRFSSTCEVADAPDVVFNGINTTSFIQLLIGQQLSGLEIVTKALCLDQFFQTATIQALLTQARMILRKRWESRAWKLGRSF